MKMCEEGGSFLMFIFVFLEGNAKCQFALEMSNENFYHRQDGIHPTQ